MTNPLWQTVLATLPASDEAPVPPRDIFRRLGVDNPSKSERASLSRALAQLESLGRVERWNSWPSLPVSGYL